MSNRKFHIGLLTAFAVLMLAGGWWAGNQRAIIKDAEMREHLLQQSTEIANVVNSEVVKKLTFTAADKGTPAFEQLREQMIIMGKTLSLRGIYSMKMRGDKIFFGPETYDEHDPLASSPGTEYMQPSPADLQVFEDKHPVTMGPNTDEYGTFVSASTPILDPHTGEILMVIGVDILAKDWQASINTARREPIIVTLVLMLLLAEGAIIVIRRNRRINLNTMQLRAWIIGPTACAILTALVIYGIYEYKELDDTSNVDMLSLKEQVRGSWNRNVTSEVRLLRAQIDNVAVNPAVLKAWQKRDLSLLTTLALPAHKQLQRDYKITHYYFFLPDRTCFLRVHQPDRRGDIIDRSTLLTAQQTGEDTWGIEMGPLGTATLRYVRPCKQDGTTIGYIELGMEIEHLVDQVARDMNVDLLTLINKKYTTREKYEAGKKTFGFTGQWDTYPDFVVAHQTFNDMCKDVERLVGYDDKAAKKHIYVCNAGQGERRIACSKIDMHDVAGRNVADIIVMRDVTTQFNTARNNLLIGLGVVFVLFGGIMVLLWSITGSAERQLSATFIKIRTERENLKAIFASSPIGMLLLDEETTIVDANAVIAGMVSRDIGQVIGQRGGGGLCCIHSMENEKGCGFAKACPECPLRKGITQVLLSGTSVHGVEIQPTLLINGNEHHPWLSISAEPVMLNGRKHIIVAVDNITERKCVQEALALNKTKLDLSLQSSKMGVWEYNIVENKRTFDNQACSLLGIDPTTFGGSAQEFFATMHPEDREKTKLALTKTVERNVPYEIEYRVVWTDGSIHHISTRGRLQHDVKGNPQMISGIIWDITERKQAEQALRKATDRLTLATRAGRVGIWEYDIINNRLEWDDQMFCLYGITRDQFCGAYEAWQSGLHPLDRQQADKEIQLAVQGEKDFDTEFRVLWPDGTIHNIRAIAVVQHDSLGKPSCMVGTNWDITAQKLAEAELFTINRHLEMATARANDMATQAAMANIAKSAFLANMSHEIRTPMNGVIGMTGLLLDTDLSSEQRKYAEIVRSSGESLLTLINDILDFSKIEAKKLELEMLDFDIRDLLEDFSGMMAIRAQEKGLEFLCAANPDVPSYLQGDPGRMRQILTNLAGNAVKFTEKGEVAVRVTVLSKTENEAMLRFSVRDTGIGISADRIGSVFESFTQEDATTTRKYGGTGLGLAISKQLSELMGGEIGVNSEKGKGSEFWFTVRLSRQPQRNRTRAIPATIKGVRILVVDDNATNREILMARLASWGAIVAESSDGSSALLKMIHATETEEPFRVVITDMQMPEMDGKMLGKAIKSDERLKDTCLIMMTSLGQQGNGAHLAEIGFAACLTKPVRPSELYTHLTASITGNQKYEKSPCVVKRDSNSSINYDVIRILVAEDNAINQLVAVKMLEKLGYRVDVVADGHEAITSLRTMPYDLVLMDCHMPVMDGYAAACAIRGGASGALNPQVPIIAMTANAIMGERERCLEAGMSDYLSKPVQLQELAATLERWLVKESKPITTAVMQTKSVNINPSLEETLIVSELAGDPDLCVVAEMFVEMAPSMLAEIREAVANADLNQLKRLAHTFKGASGSAGFPVLAQKALAIENSILQNSIDAIKTEVDKLNALCDRLSSTGQKFTRNAKKGNTYESSNS